MTSIYQRALGVDFERLHPRVQQRFGFSSTDGVAQVGRGVMEELWRGPGWTWRSIEDASPPGRRLPRPES